MLKVSKYFIMILAIMFFVITAGCSKENGGNDEKVNPDNQVAMEQEKSAKDTKKIPADKNHNLKVYYANADGTKLIVGANVKEVAGEDKYTTVMKQLIAGTSDKEAVSIIPKGTKLRSVKIENGRAYVDFSHELIKNFNGGSAGEIMLVGSIVNTLTEFPEIKTVQILVDGKKIETISGHMDTSEPLKRFSDLIKK